jgi:hypothetical protein
MKVIFSTMLAAILLFMAQICLGSAWKDTLQSYDCLEIETFYVDRDDFSSRKMERAAAIPEEALGSLQHTIVGEITRKGIVPSVKKAQVSACNGKTLVFGGQVTDYKKGSRAARMMIGLGAGKQKFEVECFLKDKQSGETLASRRVVDRKFGGIAGGDEAKGQRDFAEKVARFVKSGK